MFFVRSLHPAVRVVSSLLLVVAVQYLAFAGLAFAALALIFFGAPIRARWWQLLWRSRWLLISLVLVLAWSVAGDSLWSDFPLPAPSHEGVIDGSLQAARLAVVLGVISAMLCVTPKEDLMVAGRVLLLPLRCLGWDIDRVVVRISLALHYAGDSAQQTWRSLLIAQSEAFSVGDAAAPQRVVLSVPSTSARDWLSLLCVGVLMLGIFLI